MKQELIESISTAIERGDMTYATDLATRYENEFLSAVACLFGKGGSRSRRIKERILSLGDRLPDSMASEIIKHGISGPDGQVRIRALQAAYRRRLDTLNPELARLLENKEEVFEVRKWIIHILATTDYRRFGKLIRKLARDHSETVEIRREAVFALTNMTDDETIGTLCALLGDPLPQIRQAAAWSLSKMSSPLSTSCLLAALEDGNSGVREWAIRALRDMDDSRALQGLAEAIRRSVPEEQVRLIRLVVEKRSDIILRAITEALDSPSVEVRRVAAWALGVTPYPPAATSLQARLNDEDQQTREYAWKALNRIGRVRDT